MLVWQTVRLILSNVQWQVHTNDCFSTEPVAALWDVSASTGTVSYSTGVWLLVSYWASLAGCVRRWSPFSPLVCHCASKEESRDDSELSMRAWPVLAIGQIGSLCTVAGLDGAPVRGQLD